MNGTLSRMLPEIRDGETAKLCGRGCGRAAVFRVRSDILDMQVCVECGTLALRLGGLTVTRDDEIGGLHHYTWEDVQNLEAYRERKRLATVLPPRSTPRARGRLFWVVVVLFATWLGYHVFSSLLDRYERNAALAWIARWN